MAAYITLTSADVGQPLLRAFGRAWLVCNFLGQVLMADVGKRVYLVGGILQAENTEQRDARYEADRFERVFRG